jgi:hypothetical protein
MGVPKLSRLGVPQLCRTITSCADLWSRWILNRSCSPCQELFNGMLHATCTQRNQVNTWLSVVKSQTDTSFSYNLCCRCPNGSCEPVLDIYISIVFQWYKKIHKERGFDPCNHSLKFQKSNMTLIANNGSSFGNVSVHSHTLPHSWASPLARTLANPCLGCKPKARVATLFPTRRRGQCPHWHLQIIFTMQLLSLGSLAIHYRLLQQDFASS